MEGEIPGTSKLPSSAVQQFADNIERAFEESQALAVLRDVLQESVAVMALIALLSLLLVQMFKLPLRYGSHRWLLGLWLARRSASASRFREQSHAVEIPQWLTQACPKGTSTKKIEELKSARVKDIDKALHLKKALRYMATASLFLQVEVLMKQIQNLAQEVLDHPSEHWAALPFLAHGASADDMVILYRVDWLAGKYPDFLGRLTRPQGHDELTEHQPSKEGEQPTPRYPEAFVAAQDNVAAAVERNLDDLQIRLTTWSPMVLRGFALLAGMVIALVAGLWLVKLPVELFWILALIGLAAGYLASLAYDLLGLLGSWVRPRR